MKIKSKIFRPLIMFILIFQSCLIFNTSVIKCQDMKVINEKCLGYEESSNQDMKVINGKCSGSNELSNQVKKINLGNNLECVLKFKYLPEFVKSSIKDPNTLYGRKIIANVSFYFNKKGAPVKKILEHVLRVTFTYDKKSLVYIDDRNDDVNFSDIKGEDESKKWKIVYTHEILYDKNSCILSEMLTIFKKESLTNKIKYIENSHKDIICTPEGDIIINSKSL